MSHAQFTHLICEIVVVQCNWYARIFLNPSSNQRSRFKINAITPTIQKGTKIDGIMLFTDSKIAIHKSKSMKRWILTCMSKQMCGGKSLRRWKNHHTGLITRFLARSVMLRTDNSLFHLTVHPLTQTG